MDAANYWFARAALQRGLALVFLIAFLNAVNQFRPLLGEHGLLPVPNFVKQLSFRDSPSLFFFWSNDRAFAAFAWIGVLLSGLALAGLADGDSIWLSMSIWAAMWVLYISFVNAGQTFYAFGWESILLEACIYAVFLGSRASTPQILTIWMFRWLCFRVMFGAGLIKLRGDPCWRDLSCLDYHYETQPMPNPLSWYFHWGPEWTRQAGVLFNHFAELIVPFGLFLPQPIASIAGIITIVFQALIFASGNLSWLNLLTAVLAFSAIDDRICRAILPATAVLAFSAIDDRIYCAILPATPPPLHEPALVFRVAVIGLAVLVVALSIKPIQNLFSPRQAMNAVYNRFHFVGTYGAFGAITRPRYEIVVEGADDRVISAGTQWRAYEFKGKPGDPSRRPPQIAPYHLRLDWLMWFAAMSSYERHPWFVNFVVKLLQGDRGALSLIKTNPFPDRPPLYVRALLYEYHFTTPHEHASSGRWWKRELVASYLPPISLRQTSAQEQRGEMSGKEQRHALSGKEQRHALP